MDDGSVGGWREVRRGRPEKIGGIDVRTVYHYQLAEYIQPRYAGFNPTARI
jgi:hypothetical protein